MKVKVLGLNTINSISLVLFSASPLLGSIMLLFRQTLTLTKKNLRLEVSRHVLSTSFRALLLPIVFAIFLGYAKNLFATPSSYGIGVAEPVFSLINAMNHPNVPSKLVMVNNNFVGGDIEHVIDAIARQIRVAGKEVVVLPEEAQMLQTCHQTTRQTSDCYAAAVFHSSPSEGPGGIWNYTIRIDSGRGQSIYVHSPTNDVQLYPIPLQHAVDWTIASLNESVSHGQLPQTVLQYPYTDESESQRTDELRKRYQNTIRTALAAAYFLSQVGVIYHLVGFMSYERERGISQLLEATMPNRRRWQPQFARLLSYHLSFMLVYIPGWILIAIIFGQLVFAHTKTSLSAITVVDVSIILAILGMVFADSGDWTVGLLSLFFPPISFVNFMDKLTYWEIEGLSIDIYLGSPGRLIRFPGIVYWYCFILQILVYPLFASLVESCLYPSKSRHRSVARTGKTGAHPIRLKSMSKVYQPRWYYRLLPAKFRLNKTPTKAVENLNCSIGRGQITVLLGPNGSGKTTTLRCIAGIEKPTSGSVEIDCVGGLGICPQENVFWDLLTVEEHVKVFNALKRVVGEDPSHAIRELVSACDLEAKAHALAKTLSGGQKRKLQLAMMFTAGSQICCVDEVSSGLDPQSRRKIWEILLAKRGERTIILTTHFLDEVDHLADHVLVMSQGSVLAEGSTVDLKHRWGGGYSIQIDEVPGLPEHSHTSSNHESRRQPRRALSVERSSDVIQVVDDLEARAITDYRIIGPTIEKVFFNVLGQPISSAIVPENELDLRVGQAGGLLRSIRIMFTKRLTIFRRNFVPHVISLVIAPLVAGIASVFLKNYNGLLCGSALPLTDPITYTPSSLSHLDFAIGPSNQISSAALQQVSTLMGLGTSSSLSSLSQSLHLVETLQDFNQFIGNNYANVTPGGVFLSSNGSLPTFAYHANGPLYHAIFTQNVLDILTTNISTITLFSEFTTFDEPGLGNSLQFILYFGLAMTTYAAIFALYPTRERQQNVRALHYSNGLRALPLWIAYTMFDFCFIVSASVISVIVLSVVFHAWFALGYLFVVLTLFGLTSLLTSFVVSLFVKSQLAAFAVCAGGQAIMYVIYIVAYVSILTNASPANVDSSLNLAHYLLSTIMPPGSLARGLLVSLNILSIACDGPTLFSYPGNINAYGSPILYLVCQSFILFGFLVWWDSGPTFRGVRRRIHSQHHEEVELAEADLLAEVHRVTNSEDVLQVLHASKDFGRKRVVDDITFGVAQDEVFTLLGPNGAGKTTLMGLIRGEMTLSDRRGDVLVAGSSLRKNLSSLRAHLGYCPQFDAIDTMTVKEHLRLYAMIKGIRNTNANVNHILQLMGLTPFSNRLAANLSGGYRRRLSLGIAFIGNPDVLLLDEPSSGLDAVAKRAIWQAIKAATRGRSIVLTTHSMEEAEALADRVEIMDRRMLAIGSVDHLRRRYGDSYTVHLVTRTAPHTPDEEMERVRRWVVENFDDAVLEDKSLHGQLKFRVPASANRNRLPGIVAQFKQPAPTSQEMGVVGMAAADDGLGPPDSMLSDDARRDRSIRTIFVALESHRDFLDLESYSVAPSPLEEVFFNVVGRNSSAEEQPSGRSWRWWRK